MATPAAQVTQAPAVTATGAKPATQTDPGKAGPAAAAPTPAEIRKLKLKLDGQDVELPESEVIALAQQGKTAAKRFQEAAMTRKQAEDVIRFAKENPKEFFAKTGMNVRQWAESYLMEELKREQMSPEQKKAWENEEKLKEYTKREKDAAEKKRLDEIAAKQAEHHENYNKLFVEALGKAGLPKTAYTVKRMAELQLVNLKKQLNLNADQLVKIVREDYISEQKELFGGMDGDQMLDILGPDIVKKLSKAQISKLKAKGVRTSAGTGNQSRSETEVPEGMSPWRAHQLKIRGRLKSS